MADLDVRIIKLNPMRVASLYGFGEQPEYEAWEKLVAWGEPRGYLDEHKKHRTRIFGFNNPDPSPGSPNYGYEVWVTIGPEVKPEGDVKIKQFDGGLYAVTRCPIRGGNFDVIGDTWKKLVAWREDSKYECGHFQWLEETIHEEGLKEGEFTLDLYLPIAE
jgi:DNA gyrase inhibitor GyrI